MDLADHGQQPYVFNIEELTVGNPNFRVAQWTGQHLQVTLMSIAVGGEVGLEVHPDTDQFLRVEQGKATVKMGPAEDNLDFEAAAEDDFAILGQTRDTGPRLFVGTHYELDSAFYSLTKRTDMRKIVMHWSERPTFSAGLYRTMPNSNEVEQLDPRDGHRTGEIGDPLANRQGHPVFRW